MAKVDFTDTVNRLINKYLKSHVNTMLPAKVISTAKFASDQTVDVQPIINDSFVDGVVVELPQILGVPVQFPSAGGGLLSFPIQVGDTVALVFSQRGIDEWLISDGDLPRYTPQDRRSFNLTDAVAIPGLYTTKSNLSPNTTDVELKFANSNIRIKPDGEIIVSSSGDMMLTSAADININAVGDVNITGTNINLN